MIRSSLSGMILQPNISLNQIITLNRGDTFSAPLTINVGNQFETIRYVLGDNDKVYLGVMEANQPFEHAIIRQTYTKDDANEDGDIVINFDANDTLCLLPGTYYYEIKLEHESEGKAKVDTIVPKRKLFLVD